MGSFGFGIPGFGFGGFGGTPPFFPAQQPTNQQGAGGSPGGFNWQNLIPIGLGIASSIFNRPRGLSRQQQAYFNNLQTQLLGQLQKGPAVGDPRELASLYDQIARMGAGARTRLDKSFASRGLGQSGLLGEQFGNLESQVIPQLQFNAQVEAQRNAQARQQQQTGNILAGLGGTPIFPQGQSTAGAATGGLFETLMFLLGMQSLGRR